MGKPSKSKKTEFVGKGKVTPVQIAFIVDRYLSDNNFMHTRSTFRTEASHLIAKSPVQEAPKSLLSLGAILDEYITLKEQKVWVDQERCRLEKETVRVQNLLSGMQEVMNAYNASRNDVVTPTPPLPLPPPPPAVTSGASQADLAVARPAGYHHMYNTPAMISTSRPSNVRKDSTNFSTPVTYNSTTKRKGFKDVSDGPATSKRPRRCTQSKDINFVAQSSNSVKNQEKSPKHSDNAPNGQGSNVVKCLFNQEPQSPPANSSVPKTPPIASSSQTEKTSSPLEICSTATSNKDNNKTPQQIFSANCTIISSETIRVSPNKQIAVYSIEKNHISTCSPLKTNSRRSSMKDHVKGRLDFGASEMPMITESQTPETNSTSESEKDSDFLDLDLPDLDAFGLDFNLSEFLVDFNFESEGTGFSSQQVLDSSPDSHSGSLATSGNVEIGARQVTSQVSPTMAGFLGEKDMNLVGTDSVSAMRSVTKCIRIVSPVKNQRSLLGTENLSDKNRLTG